MFRLFGSCRMAKVFPSEFNFIPKTWILPSEYTALQSYSLESRKRRKRVKAFIVKPANGAMGNGLVGFFWQFSRRPVNVDLPYR